MENRKLSTEEIYQILQKRIVELDYKPGAILNESELAEEFDISRTPIRKIFQQLQNDNLLNIIPRFGAQVTPIDFKYMKSVFEITRVLDPYATSLAVERISQDKLGELEEIVGRFSTYDIEKDYQDAIKDDDRFHRIILSSIDNQPLMDILNGLHIHTERLWHYCDEYIDNIEIFSQTLGSVLEALKEKDKDRAEEYARIHIDEFVEKIKQDLL